MFTECASEVIVLDSMLITLYFLSEPTSNYAVKILDFGFKVLFQWFIHIKPI